MAPASLIVPDRSLGEWLREIHRERRTGKLQIALAGKNRQLFFLGGDLYLAPDHPAYDGGKVMIFIGRMEQDNSRRRRQGVIDELLGREPDPMRYDKPGKVSVTNDTAMWVILTGQYC